VEIRFSEAKIDLSVEYGVAAEVWEGKTVRNAPKVQGLIYTTNAIKALKSKICRAVRTRSHFPSDEAAAKFIFLALSDIPSERKRSVRG